MRIRIAIALAVLVPLLLVGAMWLPGLVDEKWEAMVAWAKDREQQWRERDFRRAPAWGETADGDAFDSYREALDQARVLGQVRLLADLRQRPERVAAQTADAWSLRWRPALQALSTGAHRSFARPPIDWRDGFRHRPVQLKVGWDLLHAVEIEARRRIGGGDGTRAVELVLDAATWAVDLQQSPILIDQTIACALLQAALAALRDEDLARLDSAALAMLVRGLERVDARIPFELEARGEALLLARSMTGPEEAAGDAARGDPGRTWRYGWSKRWAVADAVLALVDFQKAMEGAANAPWPQRATTMRELLAEMPRGNAWLEPAQGFEAHERLLRTSLAQVRLLRLCVAFHARQELPALADPLGEGPLQVRHGDGTATFATAGEGDRRHERTATRR
jgi:hypothetical protein